MLALPLISAVGRDPIATIVVVLDGGQIAVPGTVYVTVYVPGVLVPRLIEPVVGLIVSPTVELKVPPVAPVISGSAVPPLTQYGALG
jgi:hypothetical protein